MENNRNIAFLGTGWAFPPAFDKLSGTAEMASGREDIEQSLKILLSTRPGERVMQPDYGCNLDRLVFEPLDASMKSYMEEMIKTSILYHEPRINLLGITIMDMSPNSGFVSISVDYEIRTTNSRHNFVYLIEKK